MFFGRKKAAGNGPDYMIVGLGNPGKKYETTRHNAGFLFLDALAERMGVAVTRLKYQALCGDGELGGHRCLLLKPQTMMNLSGQAVREAANFYKIPPERILIVYDDISLDPGVLRIRRKGSAGGHNGIKSIISCLGSEEFPRIKLGVGQKPHPDYDLVDWVLGKLPEGDRKALDEAIRRACDAAELLADGQVEEAMNRYSR